MVGQIRSLDQHLQQCERCKQYRHVSAFREFALWCTFCENEDALDRDLAEADDRDIAAARDVVDIILRGKRTFDVGKSYAVKERLEAIERDQRIVIWCELIMDGKRPGFVPRKAWRIVQQRSAGKSYDDIAAEEDMHRPDVAKLEARAMQQLIDYAVKIVDDRRAPIHIPADHPKYAFLMRGLESATEDGGEEVAEVGGGLIADGDIGTAHLILEDLIGGGGEDVRPE